MCSTSSGKSYSELTTKEREILNGFQQECLVSSTLNHPNIVSFVGVHCGCSGNDISLITELLYLDLVSYIQALPENMMELFAQVNVLLDVSNGLDYLHNLIPGIIHGASNIILTKQLTAKIGDFGLFRYTDPNYSSVRTMTLGYHEYMPPECQLAEPVFTTKLDIFSFGVLMIHTVIHEIPWLDCTGSCSDERKEGRIELMKRAEPVYNIMGDDHSLYPLVVRCLHDNYDQRPTAVELIDFMSQLKVWIVNYTTTVVIQQYRIFIIIITCNFIWHVIQVCERTEPLDVLVEDSDQSSIAESSYESETPSARGSQHELIAASQPEIAVPPIYISLPRRFLRGALSLFTSLGGLFNSTGERRPTVDEQT